MEIGTNDWSNFLIDQAKIIEIQLDHTQNHLTYQYCVEVKIEDSSLDLGKVPCTECFNPSFP